MSRRKRIVMMYSTKYARAISNKSSRSSATFDDLLGNGASCMYAFSKGQVSAMKTTQNRIERPTALKARALEKKGVEETNHKKH